MRTETTAAPGNDPAAGMIGDRPDRVHISGVVPTGRGKSGPRPQLEKPEPRRRPDGDRNRRREKPEGPRAGRRKSVPRRRDKTPALFRRWGWELSPGRPGGKPPPCIGRARTRHAARPARKDCAGHAARFGADGRTSGPQTNTVRSGFRRKPPPSESSACRTKNLRGTPFPRLDRCRSGYRGEPLRRPGQPRADPASPRCPRREVPPVIEIQFPSLRPLHTNPGPTRLRRVRRPGRWSGPCVPPGGRAHIGLSLPLRLSFKWRPTLGGLGSPRGSQAPRFWTSS